MFIKIKVTPRAKKNKVVGWQDDYLRVHITAPPADGKANEALLKFLAKEWGVARSAIQIVKGQTTREKTLAAPDGVIKKQSSLL